MVTVIGFDKFSSRGDKQLKNSYIKPEMLFITTSTADILAASDEEVFVDGGDLFD